MTNTNNYTIKITFYDFQNNPMKTESLAQVDLACKFYLGRLGLLETHLCTHPLPYPQDKILLESAASPYSWEAADVVKKLSILRHAPS